MHTLKLVLKRPASRSRSANQKLPDAHGKNPRLTGQTRANNEVGSQFELLKIARCHRLAIHSNSRSFGGYILYFGDIINS